MATPISEIARKIERLADYGGQIAAIFHNFALNAERVPPGHEGGTNIIDSTVTTLKQALQLLNKQATGDGPKLFNEAGLAYLHLLTNECATTLAKIEPLLSRACLTPKEAREKRKADKKNVAQNGEPVLDVLEMELDAEAFLQTVELAKWSRISFDFEQCIERLYDLQLHLLLIFQVVKVGALSRDLSSGKVDVKSIVDYHDRVARTADLIGIQPPKGQTQNARDPYQSSSDYETSDSDSSMDLRTARRRVKNLRRTLARRPPPPPPPSSFPPPIVPFNPPVQHSVPIIPLVGDARVFPPGPPPLGPPAYESTVNIGTAPLTIEKQEVKPKDQLIKAKPVNEPKPLKPEPVLFKSNSNSFGFKIKSLFRSKQSLAEEMKSALANSESQLVAYLVRGPHVQQVPHSAFHSLESTHMKTILSQLNNDEWYKTFSILFPAENDALGRILRPDGIDKPNSRDIVVLKIVEHNRFNAWFLLVKDLLQKQAGVKRVLLVIAREKAANIQESTLSRRRFLNLPIRHDFTIQWRPPPGLPVPTRSFTRNVDLRDPPWSPASNWHISFPLPCGPPPSPDFAAEASPGMNHDARLALTIFTEYTLREKENYPGPIQRPWSLCQLTQESSSREALIDRIHAFNDAGGDPTELKMRLTGAQSTQISRLMDEIKLVERDQRFEWSWVEISLYKQSSMISYSDLMVDDQDAVCERIQSITHIHLVAQRTLRPYCIPIRVYNQLMVPPMLPTAPRSGPAPPGFPPRPNYGPPCIQVEPLRRRARSISSISSSGSGSDSSSVSDNSEGGVRRRLRKYRAKKVKKNQRIRIRSPVNSDWSASESESEEEEDVIEIRVKFSKGGDVVRALLQLWTQQDEEGKGKVVE